MFFTARSPSCGSNRSRIVRTHRQPLPSLDALFAIGRPESPHGGRKCSKVLETI
jgi:hypothetical protein